MIEPSGLTGPSRAPASGGAPRHLVILLHGIGADGNDLIGLAADWAGALPDAEFVAPNAPFPCDMAPVGYQWFSHRDLSPAGMLAGAQAAASGLNAFIDRALDERSLTDADLALVGFSQGTMMALYVAPRRSSPCAAVLGYSGALLGPDTLAEEAVSRPETMLIHGSVDEIVPVQALPMALIELIDAGFGVRTVVRPGLAHGIDPEGVALGGRFLTERLSS